MQAAVPCVSAGWQSNNNKERQIMRPSFAGLIGVALLASASAPANADSHTKCDTQSTSQVDLHGCLLKAEKEADAALKSALGNAMAAAKELDDVTAPRRDVVQALTAGQDVWVQYRDKHCEYVGTTWGGGSGTGIAITRCRIDHARARSKELTDGIAG
jgi:uncharacterized protein YecT (DUF1311 family)